MQSRNHHRIPKPIIHSPDPLPPRASRLSQAPFTKGVHIRIGEALLPAAAPKAKKNLIGTRMQTGTPLSRRKQRTGSYSNRYKNGGAFARPEKINRNTKLLESAVSHCKQREEPPINRHISAMSVGRSLDFPSPHTIPPAPSISIRKLELIESPLNPSQSTMSSVLVTNLRPSRAPLFEPPYRPSAASRLDVNPDSCYKYLLCFASFSLSVTSLSRSLNPEEQCRLGVRTRWFMGVAKLSVEAC
jgi:hypothetical protein